MVLIVNCCVDDSETCGACQEEVCGPSSPHGPAGKWRLPGLVREVESRAGGLKLDLVLVSQPPGWERCETETLAAERNQEFISVGLLSRTVLEVFWRVDWEEVCWWSLNKEEVDVALQNDRMWCRSFVFRCINHSDIFTEDAGKMSSLLVISIFSFKCVGSIDPDVQELHLCEVKFVWKQSCCRCQDDVSASLSQHVDVGRRVADAALSSIFYHLHPVFISVIWTLGLKRSDILRCNLCDRADLCHSSVTAVHISCAETHVDTEAHLLREYDLFLQSFLHLLPWWFSFQDVPTLCPGFWLSWSIEGRGRPASSSDRVTLHITFIHILTLFVLDCSDPVGPCVWWIREVLLLGSLW